MLHDKSLKLLLGREPTESIKWEEEIVKELEESEDSLDYFNLLQDAIKFFEDQKREVRTVSGRRFFHGKAYIGAAPSLDKLESGVAVVGSSNFTFGGLVYNRELNMVDDSKEALQQRAKWFKNVWGQSEDFKERFLKFLKNYVTTRSPYEIVAKALFETYRENIEIAMKIQKTIVTLYPHQALSVMRTMQMLEKYRGVSIADSTGLGKTRVALSLINEARMQGKKTLLIAPDSVLTTWEKEMRSTDIIVEKESSEKLFQNPDSIVEKYCNGEEDRKNFIVVDEAHYFRKPSTNRYSALRQLILANNAEVVLMTATPVNTSLMDLYYLFSLYPKEDCISDIYDGTLKGCFTSNQKKWLQNEPIDMDAVLRRFMVRHSRSLAKALDKEDKIKFPRRVLDNDPKNKYRTNIDYEEISNILNSMNFAFYDLSIDRVSEIMRMPDGSAMAKDADEKKKELLKNKFNENLT